MDKSAGIFANARAMAGAPEKGIGPDVVIVVSVSDCQAGYWQKRLTGPDDIHGSGSAVKKNAIVLSVSESSWKGGAGNALGTLNGFIEASLKAAELGLVSCQPKDAAAYFIKGFSGKSIFMFHTAGKGMRMAPLPGAECNSKSSIKLPGIVKVAGKDESISILESTIKAVGTYAASRKGRLGVFWSDQVVINERDADFSGRHHVEIFGQLVELDDDIKSYGILLPGEDGCCRVREKLDASSVKELLGRSENKVYRSVGSFTVSLEMLMFLIETERHILDRKEGILNTDPDWWQPLTSDKGEYIGMMGEKGVDETQSGAQWEKVNSMWASFASSEDFTASGLPGKVGFKDLGENSLWWDYGQNGYFLENMRLLAEDTDEGKAARIFFGAEKYFVKNEKNEKTGIENSLIMRSRVAAGSLKGCVVVGSDLGKVYASDSVIIASDIIELNSKGALCYNVVSEKNDLKKGTVTADVFHPQKGRITMTTEAMRDGKADWKMKVAHNEYSYEEIQEMMKDVTAEDARRVKAAAARKLRKKQRHPS
jgi:hypothetical protein